ncbi:unnamed protein product [Rotaria socialis]|uniref:Ubiquitin-like domain-containing protein n=1 Tax=Rotaria socialis TaxID=392032 RepID=A0A818DAS9_9BILA|nr:unnamed protein product [Rotaria socialis]CAF4683564.1 unnamed protein product [Rotaria socialis]
MTNGFLNEPMTASTSDDASEQKQKEEYFKEQDAYIKGKFAFVQNGSHPCLSQGKKTNLCTKGEICLFTGFPNDTCIYYIIGRCTQEKCHQVHYEEFAGRYTKYKQEFQNIQRQKFQQKCELEREQHRQKNEANIDIDQQWLDENTRICPKCILPVEKGQGCPDMYCRKCQVHFDWGQMETATGGKNQNKLEQAKRNTRKFISRELPKDSLQLFVVLEGGKSELFNIQLESTVEELMKQLQVRTGIPIEFIRLQYASKQLKKDLKIRDYGFFNNSTIFLVQRLPGGF